MVKRWGIRSLGLLLVAVAGCTDPVINEPPPPPPPPNLAPVIVIDGPTEVAVGSTVRFDASNTTDPEEDAIEYFWEEGEDNPANNFFDGVALNESRIQMLVDVAGTFTYKLSAKDAVGNESSSAVTLTVTETPGVAPVISGVRINGILFNFASNPTPNAFTTSSKPLTFTAIGTDEDTPTAELIAKYGAPIVNGSYMTPDMADDADGFRTVTAQVWLEDPEGHTSSIKTVTIRIVPKATQDLKPRAAYVNCAATGAESGTATAPYHSIQAGFNAAITLAVEVRPDVWVAKGTCTESVVVDYKDVNIYGLFDPANGWARRTDIGTSTISRFQFPTILINPTAESLLYTVPVPTAGALLVDGITFKLSGQNFYGIHITTPATEDETLIIQNNEFIGLAVTASTAPKVGGGLLIKNGPGSNPILIRRNLFAVGAMDDGSRFQVWTQPRSGNTASRRTEFYSNVVYAGVGFSGSTQSYSCSGSQNPFAVCLYKAASETSLNPASWNSAARNLFWITQGNATAIPTVLTTGGGYLEALGNVFKNTAGADKLRFLHAVGNGSTNAGAFEYNRFPTYAAPVTYLNTSSTWIDSIYKNCISANQFGKDPGTGVCGTLGLDAAGSTTYGSATSGVVPWRLSSTSFLDVVTNSLVEIRAPAMWDFDGRYGAGNDDGVVSTKEYNAGPFEPAASIP